MKSLRFYCLMLSSGFLWSCTNAPEACFDPYITLAEVGEQIAFANCSLFYTSSFWEFGDGDTTSVGHPRHTYTAVGDYLVVLTVSDEKGKHEDQISQIIKVGNRSLSYATVTALPANDPLGNPWDGAGDPADVQLMMKPSTSSTWQFTTTENTNLTNSIPFIWDLSASFFDLTYEPWDFMLVDNDGASADTMGFWTINLGDTVFADRKIPLTGPTTDIDISYIIK